MDYKQEFAKLVTAINMAVSNGTFKSSTEVAGVHQALQVVGSVIEQVSTPTTEEEKPKKSK